MGGIDELPRQRREKRGEEKEREREVAAGAQAGMSQSKTSRGWKEVQGGFPE